jgi:Rhomboid family
MSAADPEAQSAPLVVAPRLAQAALAATVAALVANALFEVDAYRYFALDLDQRGVSWLWQVLLHPLLQPSGSTGLVGQLLMCMGLYWSAAELERDLGTTRTASVLLLSSVGTAIATAVVTASAHVGGRLAGADALVLSSLAAYAWLHPARPLPSFDSEDVKRSGVLLGLVVACAALYFFDRDRAALTARLCAVMIGIVVGRADLTPLLERVGVEQRLRRVTAAAARSEPRTRVLQLLPAVQGRWHALRQRLAGELERGSLPPPAEQPSPPKAAYWDNIDPALPLALIDPLRKER